jgi:hypothetical protein
MYRLIHGYLTRFPRGTRTPTPTGDTAEMARCTYTPHSPRATTATLLLGTGVDNRKVQDLLAAAGRISSNDAEGTGCLPGRRVSSRVPPVD